MAKNALYFPYINVPPDPWLMRMVLYWDRLSSIVPSDHIYRPELLDPKMRDLVASGLVHQLMPGPYLYGMDSFDQPFIRYAKRWLERRRGNLGRNFSKIHMEKLDRLCQPLRRMGLLRDGEYPWVEMPTPLANAFMSYLAASLGQLSEIDAAPITNSVPLGSSLATIERTLIRDALLERLLPVPSNSEHLTIDSVLAFKAKYSEHATRFRQRLEEECILVSGTTNTELRREKLEALRAKLQRESDEIAEAMRLSWKSVTLGSILPIISTALPVIDADWKLQTATAVGAVGSVGVAVIQASQGFGQARNAENRPMAYVPLVQKYLFNLSRNRTA